MADALSHVGPIHLEKEAADEILERARNSQAPRAECDDPRMIEHAKMVEEDIVIQVRAIADDEPKIHHLQQADWPMLQ